MNLLDHFKGGNSVSPSNDGRPGIQVKEQWGQMGYEEKKAAIGEEMRKLNQHPKYSTYVAHRYRVLNKALELLSIQRTASQEKELELLFSGLSL